MFYPRFGPVKAKTVIQSDLNQFVDKMGIIKKKDKPFLLFHPPYRQVKTNTEAQEEKKDLSMLWLLFIAMGLFLIDTFL